MKLFTKLFISILNKLFNGKLRSSLSPVIRKLYSRIATEDFQIATDIVCVKKGKIKYKLVFFETPDQHIRINIGRHKVENNPGQIIL